MFCSLDISEEYDALLTSSVDCTVRMWTLNGHFIGMTCYFFVFVPNNWSMSPRELFKTIKYKAFVRISVFILYWKICSRKEYTSRQHATVAAGNSGSQYT